MNKLDAQVLAQRLIETPYDTDVPDDLREQVWKIAVNPDRKRELINLVYPYLLKDMNRFEALKRGLEDYNDGTSDDEFYKSYKTDLTDAMLDEYDWLDENDFVQIEEEIAFNIEDDVFLIRRFNELTSLKDKIIKNLGKSQFEPFIGMMLLALKYKILKIKDPHFSDPIYAVAYKKEQLENYWKETCKYIKKEDQDKIKTVYLEA